MIQRRRGTISNRIEKLLMSGFFATLWHGYTATQGKGPPLQPQQCIGLFHFRTVEWNISLSIEEIKSRAPHKFTFGEYAFF